MLSFFKKKVTAIALIFIVVGIFFVWLILASNFFWYPSALDKKVHSEFEKIPYGVSFPLSSLATLKQYSGVCVLTPYALSGPDYSTRLRNIFGKVDLGNFRNDIVKEYSGIEYNFSFYLVKNDQLSASADFFYKKGFFPPYAGRILKEGKGLSAGCYDLSQICFSKMNSDKNGDETIVVDVCNHQNQDGQ